MPIVMTAPRTPQQGATLIEVLIAMLVLAVGLLGMAGLQATSVKGNQSSYYRSQATLLAGDIADAMRANRQDALDGDYNTSSSSRSSSDSDGDGEESESGSRSKKDLAEWQNNLAALLPEGSGTIQIDAKKIVTITISWDDSRADAARSDTTDKTTPELQTFKYQTRI